MTKVGLIPRLSVEETTEGLVAFYQWHLFRFLFSDGRTLDVKAIRDDSDLREAMRLYAEAERIEGVAVIPDEPPPVKAPVKAQRSTKKK